MTPLAVLGWVSALSGAAACLALAALVVVSCWRAATRTIDRRPLEARDIPVPVAGAWSARSPARERYDAMRRGGTPPLDS